MSGMGGNYVNMGAMSGAMSSGLGRNSISLSRASNCALPITALTKSNRAERLGKIEHENATAHVLKHMFFSPFCVLLICFPAGIWAATETGNGEETNLSPEFGFWLNFFGLIPLAKILGDATEELDASLNNEVISGLINATLGNAVEMIITIAALQKGLIETVKCSLLGSVLSNMLLVLGCAFFFGGILGKGADGKTSLVKEKEQSFQINGALCSMTCLLLSCMAFALPTVFVKAGHESKIDELSMAGAVIMTISYLAYLVFQLVTHKQMFAGDEDEEEAETSKMLSQSLGAEGQHIQEVLENAEDEPHLSLPLSVAVLAITTVLTACSSEYLVGSVERMTKEGGSLTQAFIGIILLPFVGNACEHMAAVRFAIADKPGLAVSIAVGSSTQIAMFVVPFSVIMGRLVGVPDAITGIAMNLDFGMLNTTVMLLSVLIVMSIVSDGRSNWLEGWLLMASFFFVAMLYWYVPDAPIASVVSTSLAPLAGGNGQ